MLILAKLYIVGIGPGEYDQMTVKAIKTLEKCSTIAGYTVYAELIKEHFTDKEFIVSGMRQEKERCIKAFESARTADTALICSGDAGIYALAGLALELNDRFADIEVEIVPGVTAALSGGAALGAPFGHDTAFISLSDLLTPADLIEKRLRCAASADFVICIYNPSSKKRKDYLKKACGIVLEYQKPDTVCGIVKNIGRSGEYKEIMSLGELLDYDADMFTTVFIGNSQTVKKGGYMVTPRGYIL